MLIKEKINGDIKKQECAGGIKKKQETLENQEADSSTVALESVFKITAVDEHEGLDVATFEILVAYLYTETYQDVIIFLEGERSDLMVKVSSKI